MTPKRLPYITVDSLKAMSPETRRAYVLARLEVLMPTRKPHYEGGWWYSQRGHYPRPDGPDPWNDRNREGHSGTSRADCVECWMARLEEFWPQ